MDDDPRLIKDTMRQHLDQLMRDKDIEHSTDRIRELKHSSKIRGDLDRLLALETDEITLEDMKWVVLMVLFNQPGQEANFAWMEDLMFDTEQEYRH